MHQLAATAATQAVTTDMGYVAGAAFKSAVENSSDPSYMSVFAPQLLAAQVAQKADEETKAAKRLLSDVRRACGVVELPVPNLWRNVVPSRDVG